MQDKVSRNEQGDSASLTWGEGGGVGYRVVKKEGEEDNISLLFLTGGRRWELSHRGWER